LRGKNTSSEKSFDLTELFGNDRAQLPLVGSNLQRGINEETSFLEIASIHGLASAPLRRISGNWNPQVL
jgi:hypothetical protein